ncbi:MAG: methyltransferase domain-containing protein [Ginsengibacter sp.]
MSLSKIYEDGTYLKNNPAWGVPDSKWKAKIIKDLLEKNRLHPNKITEVGCGAGGILEALSDKAGTDAQFSGYDISLHAIKMARQRETKNLKFYNEDFLIKEIHTDLLLVIDVVEHIPAYYEFLQNIKSKSDYFVFHIPLDLSCRTIFKPHVLQQQREAVGHLHYFTREMVLWFLKDTGYEILDWVYTKPVVDVHYSQNTKTFIKKLLRNLSFAVSKDISAKMWGNYSMMILAK